MFCELFLKIAAVDDNFFINKISEHFKKPVLKVKISLGFFILLLDGNFKNTYILKVLKFDFRVQNSI